MPETGVWVPLQHAEKGVAAAGQLLGAHARDSQEFGAAARARGYHGQQGGVAEDHVGWHFASVGQAQIWKVIDLPAPVGMTPTQSRPSRTVEMIASWPGRNEG